MRKAVILDGSRNDQTAALFGRIKNMVKSGLSSNGWEVHDFHLADMNIKPCLGCFSCWIKTPGLCALKDDESQILPRLANAGLLALITPITFGGYSSVLKKSMDRIIPVLLPFFHKVDGEIHHPQRYGAWSRFLAIGTLPRPDAESERIFRLIVGRNSLNMSKPRTAALVFTDGTSDGDIDLALKSHLSSEEVSR